MISRYLFILTIVLAPISARPEQSHGEACPGDADKGPCNRNIFKWTFDHEKKYCTTFIWGGCGGNDKNRFDSEKSCIEKCFLHTADHNTTDSESESKNVTVIVKEKRGPKLSFQENGDENTFMFAQSNTFIQIDGDVIQTFQLRLCRQISFQFRTRLPHGLLVYHNVQVPNGVSLQPYALYIIVQQGQLKVVHVYGKHSTALTVGRGLNNDQWHAVTVRIDVHAAKLLAIVDELKDETDLKGLDTENNYGVSANVTSVILIGGLSSEERLHGVKYIIESFVGCIKDVVLSTGKSASDLLQISPLIATKHENVQEGCKNKCMTSENLCFKGSRCVNHYYTRTCDCFGTKYEGEFCDIYTATVLTLRGSSYVSYRVYDWKDRVHSSVTRFSMLFKTRFDDSALLYAAGGEHGIDHYIAASIFNETVHVVMDFGLNSPVTIILGKTPDFKLHEWNNLTIFHEHEKVHVILNDEIHTVNITGNPLLYIDPEIYIGGGPELQKKTGLKSTNNFVGSLKYVFYNDISIIYELNKNNPKVHYIGILRPEFYESDVHEIPITFPFSASHIWWHNDQVDSLSLSFYFKASSNLSVIASSEAQTGLYWEVRVVNDEVRFELLDSAKNATDLISVKKTPGVWHFLNVTYGDGEITVSIDKKGKTEKIGDLKFAVGDKIKIAAGSRSNSGLVGCMRDIEVNGVRLEPRTVLQTERVVGEVTLDDCRFVNACQRPNTCEHGGKCSVKENRLTCDCTNTGYIGTNCHFAVYRKTCEELALLGHTKPDVYLIDIDGNGRFPPAHVRCEFPSIEESTKTIVEHNLPSQMDVRSPSEQDFSFSIKYREFNAEMLQELVSHSLNCSQYIKYDCFKAPLDLHSSTWFISSDNQTVDFIGNVKRGTCPCSEGRQCENASQWCNCDDVTDDKWNTDDGYYTTAESLGITEMYFLQQPGLPEDALGRITLGPLECVETNTQRYVVTFTTSQSYIEVPGWRKGDLAFSFRTTGKKAILLYQPPIRPNYPSFMIALTSDHQLTFNFTLNTGVSKELVIDSGKRKLNGGEWHKVWIDYNQYHVRLMINQKYQMVDLKPEEEFGPFEGSMFIGGAPMDLPGPRSSVHQGLIGCFRGLVVNDEVLDIYSYMSVHLSEIIKDCKPSCVPNPCENGAQCKELWSTFECVCPNPWAFKGAHCETNINTNAVTFTQSESYIHKNYFTNDTEEEKTILTDIFKKRILVNLRTYDNYSLVFYANDHLNNFVHLYIINGTTVEYLFNYENQIYNITVLYSDLNTSKPVQIAITREENQTTMFVNHKNNSVPVGVKLLEVYSNKPWINPDKEVLAPQRPPAPPTQYFQLNIGGYDPETLLKVTDDGEDVPGYIGCFRGFQIGDTLIDLPSKINYTRTGVIAHCNMKCDEEPCKNGGICIEDFRHQEHTCDCEHTSYYGEFCNEEKGADFNGEAILSRVFVLNGTVDHVKIQAAFSSQDVRQKHTVLLLLQTENNRSYYLLVGLTPEGFLIVQEDREGAVFSATVKKKSFINGARHSVYYKRDFNDSELLVDKELTEMEQIPPQTFTNIPELGANEVQIGGEETNDPRFAIYKKFSGCLSNILIEVNEHVMKPLEEYMLFTKNGAEKVNVSNSHGVRSAQCSADFDVFHEKTPGTPNQNISQGKDKTWVQDAPQRILYTSFYATDSVEEDNMEHIIIIALASFFVLVLICICYDVYRVNKKYKERKEFETDASILLSKQQAAIMLQENNKPPIEILKKPQTNGKLHLDNGNGGVKAVKDDAEEVLIPEEVPLNPLKRSDSRKDRQKRISFRDSASELTWDTPDITSEILSPMLEEDEDTINESLDKKYEGDDEEDDDVVSVILKNGIPNSGQPSQPNGSTPNELAPETSQKPGPNIYRPSKIVTNTRPLLVGEHHRKFDNPISYLGGPKLPNRNRWSVESVVSID